MSDNNAFLGLVNSSGKFLAGAGSVFLDSNDSVLSFADLASQRLMVDDIDVAEALRLLLKKRRDFDVIVKCGHCGQWAAAYTACVHCGAAVDPVSL